MKGFAITSIGVLLLSLGPAYGLVSKPLKDQHTVKTDDEEHPAQDFAKWAADAQKGVQKLQKDYSKGVAKAAKQHAKEQHVKGKKESSLIEKPKEKDSKDDTQSFPGQDLAKWAADAQKGIQQLQKDYSKGVAKAVKQNTKEQHMKGKKESSLIEKPKEKKEEGQDFAKWAADAQKAIQRLQNLQKDYEKGSAKAVNQHTKKQHVKGTSSFIEEDEDISLIEKEHKKHNKERPGGAMDLLRRVIINRQEKERATHHHDHDHHDHDHDHDHNDHHDHDLDMHERATNLVREIARLADEAGKGIRALSRDYVKGMKQKEKAQERVNTHGAHTHKKGPHAQIIDDEEEEEDE